MPRLLKSLQRLFISFSIKAKVLTVTRTVLRVSLPTSALTSHDPSHDPTFTLLQPHTGLLPAPPGVPGALLPSCLLFSVPGTPRIPRHSSAISTLPGRSPSCRVSPMPSRQRSALPPPCLESHPHFGTSDFLLRFLLIYFTYSFCLLSISLHGDMSFMLIGYFFTPEFPTPGIVLGL